MKYQKILLISKDEISAWESCKHITSNLAESYFQAFKDQEVVTLKVAEDLSLFQAYAHAEDIKKNKYDLIVWLDHKPNAALMVEALDVTFDQFEYEQKPKFLVHLFGDFVLDCNGWEAVEKSIQRYPVHFIAASERQKKLVETFCVTSSSVCSVIPFPVNEQKFNVENLVDNRKEYREKLNAQDDFVIIYTGRISYQKNVDKLIKIFKSLESALNKKAQLWIIGPWDDILLPYAGIEGLPGSYYLQFNSANPLIEADLQKIKFIGQLNSSELLKAYHAADLFMSLSTFNDEDYGMSVAESLATGLPCLLSDWAGFASFKTYSKDVELVKVELTNDGPQLNIDEARKKLMKTLLMSESNLEKRTQTSKEAFIQLSVGACSEKIKRIVNDTDFIGFEKFDPVFYKMCALFKVSPLAPFRAKVAQFLDIYKEIYKAYVS